MRTRQTAGAVTRPRVFRQLSVAAAALAVGVLGMAASAPALAVSHPRPQAGGRAASAGGTVGGAADYRRACALPTATRAECLMLIRTNVARHLQSAIRPDSAPTGVGYGPASLQSAYKLPSRDRGRRPDGRDRRRLRRPERRGRPGRLPRPSGVCPPATAPRLLHEGQPERRGRPLPPAAGARGWATEESLDLDMVSAICPNCHILLVEANSRDIADLGTAVNAAVTLGAKFVSNSYGGSSHSGDATYDADVLQPPGRRGHRRGR